MNSTRRSALAYFFVLFLVGCGQDSGRRAAPQQIAIARGRLIERLLVTGNFSESASVETLDFGGAVLTKLVVPLTVTVTDASDTEALDELFWESSKQISLLLPDPKKCVPTLFGIQKNEGRYELRFWGWDNVGVSTDCEDFIHSIKEQGLHVKLASVRWAEVGVVNDFEAKLSPTPKP